MRDALRLWPEALRLLSEGAKTLGVDRMSGKPPVSIVVDSAASLPDEIAGSPQIHVVPMRVTLGGKTYADGRDLSPSDLYRLLRESPELPSTSAPSPASFLEAIRVAAAEAQSVLCLTVGSQFSASFESASVAARNKEEAISGLEVSVLDTGSAAGGQGLIALEAWRAAKEGRGLPDVRATAERVMSRVKLLAYVDTLYYLWKGGRVPRVAHAGASLLKIKPVFELAQGQVHTVARPRTRRRAMAKLLELMRVRVKADAVHATVMHADAADAAEELRLRVEAEYACDELFVSEFTPAMGAHIGPGLVGVAFWGE